MEIIKGKRTKRPRLSLSPLALTIASTSSSMSESGGGVSDNSGGGGGDRGGFDRVAATATATSTTNSGDLMSAEEEEEDMANCLILLAQGGGQTLKSPDEPSAPTANKAGATAGVYVYQCKTCDRCFPSFQALGGHRASHNKPNKANNINGGEEKKTTATASMMMTQADQDDHEDSTSTALSLGIPTTRVSPSSTNKSRVHECSVCGAEFSSGQALGGHMRRHRTTSMSINSSSTAGEPQEIKKSGGTNTLALDLNLPAPVEDDASKFVFASKKQVIVFSASSLVDCHY